ncbi:MAG: IS110 family transposase [Actinomycetota bacterium]|nr:IS110 family transposase [Actinomycetota bacterium]
MGPDWVQAIGSDMTQTAFKFLATSANPHQVKRMGRARLARWFQRETRKAWGERRADAVVAAAQATLALWGPDGLDYDALAADIAVEATLALELSRQIARLDERIFDLYCEADPDHIVLSTPGVGKILAAQIRGRLGDPHRFASLAAARSFSGLGCLGRTSSGLTDSAGGPTKQGDACLREALFLAADHARKVDPQLAARYQRLMCDTGRHHISATCTIATRARDPHRRLSAQRHSLPATRPGRPAHQPSRRTSHRCRAPSDPARDPGRTTSREQHPQPTEAGRAHPARSRQALQGDARPTTSLNLSETLDIR